MLSGPTADRRCGVLGRPIAHSLSPLMHRAAYADLGLVGWQYDAHEVDEQALPGFLASLDEQWRGLSLTMPLKRAVVPLLDERSPTVDALEVANTVLVEDGRLAGHNTDAPGAAAALAEAGVDPARSVRVLGAGATAASVLHALAGLGMRSVEVAVRDAARARPLLALADRLGVPAQVVALPTATATPVDLLVSTVPAGAVAERAEQLVAPASAVLDVVYDPWPTPLTTAAGLAGRPVVTGLDLLAHQAALQVRLMTGADVAAGRLRDAAAHALGSRSGAGVRDGDAS